MRIAPACGNIGRIGAGCLVSIKFVFVNNLPMMTDALLEELLLTVIHFMEIWILLHLFSCRHYFMN